MRERPLLLCCDLDRTLIPNGAQPESPDARARFARLVSAPEVTLIYATGRDLGRVEDAIVEWGLPIPSLVIADVGTSLYAPSAGAWLRWTCWDDAIAPDWGGHKRPLIAALLQGLGPLRLQAEDRQGDYKLSYELDLDLDPRGIDREIQARLASAQIRARLVWSVDEQARVGLLDVLPASASKRHALEFAASKLDFAHDEIIFAGDSGNDLEVLNSPLHAILVANAREAVRREAVAASSPKTLYVARGGWGGMNGCYAAGILEGVAHFRPDRAPSLRAPIAKNYDAEEIHP